MAAEMNQLRDGTLRWLAANASSFTLPVEDASEGDIQLDGRRKAFGELALACMLTARHPTLRASPELATMAHHVSATAAEPSFSFDMMRRPNLFPLYVMVMLALDATGVDVRALRASLQRILDYGFMDAIERTPWNQIDMKYYLDLGGFRDRFASYESLFRHSSAYLLPSIPHLRNLDVYALTHILFHLADFGRRDLRPILGTRFEETVEYTTVLLGAYTHARDWDLTAELLICCACLGCRAHPLIDLAWEALCAAQTPAGDLPSRYFDVQSPELASPDTAAAYVRKINYHPTLVTLLATMSFEVAPS